MSRSRKEMRCIREKERERGKRQERGKASQQEKMEGTRECVSVCRCERGSDVSQCGSGDEGDGGKSETRGCRTRLDERDGVRTKLARQ
jgi:hypothetical protein